MAQRLRVGAREGHAAAAAGAGLARDFFIGGQQGAAVRLVSRLSATAATGGFPGGRALDRGCVAGRGLGGILRILAETGVEIGDLLTQVGEFGLEVAEEGKESGLGRGGDQILDQSFQYGSQVFAEGERVKSEFDYRQFDLTYTYSVLRGKWYELGVGLGVQFLEAEASANVPGTPGASATWPTTTA